MVKRFLTTRAGQGGRANRYAPETVQAAPQFTLRGRKAIAADAEELSQNPRSRSAKLRVAIRTDASAGPVDASSIGMPKLREIRG